ncbi:MAG TPA: DUF1345 domain-containing protein [Gaiellaceae bacterium]|nr:DUF1345 domain-containing protein [Gaiellaceae bacterium]
MTQVADPTARAGSGLRNLTVAAVAFAVVLAASLGGGLSIGASIAAAWGAAALSMLVRIWSRIGRWDAEQTAAHARAEDFSRATADVIILSASVCSLVPVGLTILSAGRHHGREKVLLILLAVAVVALSWWIVHTVFTLRYGDLFYATPTGGIDFNDDGRPDYHDFAYLALTIGMTYQVSDTNLTDTAMRRTATRHGLLSFVFGTVIVALLINTVASLLR